MSAVEQQTGLHGIMAEFATPEELVTAAERAYAAGYRKMDGYSPMPVEGLSEAIGFTRNFVSPAVLTGGLLGCMGGFCLAVLDRENRLRPQYRRTSAE